MTPISCGDSTVNNNVSKTDIKRILKEIMSHDNSRWMRLNIEEIGPRRVRLSQAIFNHTYVSSAFIWSDTVEGHVYWGHIIATGHTPESLFRLQTMLFVLNLES